MSEDLPVTKAAVGGGIGHPLARPLLRSGSGQDAYRGRFVGRGCLIETRANYPDPSTPARDRTYYLAHLEVLMVRGGRDTPKREHPESRPSRTRGIFHA